MTSPVTSVRVLMLVFVALTTLQESILAQRRERYGTDGSDPFTGVYYSHSRVAFSPRRNRTQDSLPPGYRRSYPSYVRVTPSTTTRRPDPTTTRRTLAAFSRLSSPPSYLEAHRMEKERVIASRPSSPPSYLEVRQGTPERVTYKPAYLVESDRAAKKREWQRRYGNWKPERVREFAATSEYRAIKEGSYYDHSNSSAPVDTSGSVFNWDSTGRRHRHRHHHEVATGYSDRYAEFQARERTYSPPQSHTTTTRRPRQGRLPSTTPSLRRDKTPTTRRYRRRPTADGSTWYHMREKQRPLATVRRTSESVSYVSGSYFPTSGSLQKPLSGFAVQHRGVLDPDPVTPSPVPPVYQPIRRHPNSFTHPFAGFTGN